MGSVVKLPRRQQSTREELLVSAEGHDIVRRFATRYWFDARFKEPSRNARGFPKAEEGSIEGAGRVIMKGWCAKVQCYDRVLGRVLWTLKRGPKLRGTNVYTVLSYSGDA